MPMEEYSGYEEIINTLNDIERRLANIEASTSPSAIEELKERLTELEDLQMLLQAELMQVKYRVFGEPIEFPYGDLEKRLIQIEELIKKGVPVAVSEDILKRIEKIEKISNIEEVKKLLEKVKFEETGKALERIEKLEDSLKEMKNEIEKKILRIEDVVERSGKVLTEKGAKAFLDKINEAKIEIDRKIEELELAKKRVERAIAENQDVIRKVEEVDINIERINNALLNLKTQEEKINSDIEKIETLKERINQMLENKVKEIEIIKEGFQENVKEVESRVDSIIKNRIGDLEFIKQSLENKMSLFSKEIKTETEKSQSLRNYLSTKIEDFEKFIKDMNSQLDEKIKRLEDVENLYKRVENIEGKTGIALEKARYIDNIKEELRMTNVEIEKLLGEVATIKKEVSQIKISPEIETKAKKMIEELYNNVENKIKQNLENIEKSRKENEKIISSLSDEVKRLSSEKERIIQSILDVVKRVDSLGSSFNGFSKKAEERLSGYDAKIKDVEKFKSEIRDELENIKSEFSADFVKRIEDVKKNLNERLYGYDTKTKEIEKIDARIKEIEKIKEEFDKVRNEIVLDLAKRIDSLGLSFNESSQKTEERFSLYETKIKEIDKIRSDVDKIRNTIFEDVTKMFEKIRNDLENVKKEKAVINEENVRKMIEERIEKMKEDLETDVYKEMNENMRKFSKFIENIISEERKVIEKQSREIKEALREREKFFKSGEVEKFEKLVSELENRVSEIQKNIDEIQARIPVIIE